MEKKVVIEQLKTINKIYDVMALCSSYILKKIDESTYEFATFDDDDYENLFDAIERYSCEKEQKGYRTAFDELREYLIEFMALEVTIEKCYAVVKYIDELIDVEISCALLGRKQFQPYSSLNEQYTDQVKIIPQKVESIISRNNYVKGSENGKLYEMLRKRRESACSLLDKETQNYMIWDKTYITKYPFNIYHLDEKSEIFKHFYGQDKIEIGIVPFTNEPLASILDIQYNRHAFSIERMYEEAEEKLKMKYNDICDRCAKDDIDFLVFPEMLMSDSIISSNPRETKAFSPQIIINGSIWKDYTNRSVITDGNGKEIACYYKKEPFIFERGGNTYKEHLNRDMNKEYCIIEIEGVGRLGIGICKDLINEDFKLFHKYIGTDILFIPSYSASMDLQSSAEELTKEYNCIVVMANACSALEGKTEETGNRRIGFITVPAKAGTDRSLVIKMYMENACKEECESRCVGRRITIDFSQTVSIDGNVSYKIVESSF